MNLGLVYLLVRSVHGRLVRAMRLLRQPKYLVGVIGFIAWISIWAGPAVFRGSGRNGRNVHFVNAELLYEAMGDALPVMQLIVALIVALLVSLWWLVPWSRMALNLSETEIHMLAPMPVKRRHLIQYATLKSQPGILFGCTMMTVFLGYGGPLARVRWFASFWLVLTLWDLHSKGRSLWLERQKEVPPGRAWRNRLLLVGAIVTYWVFVGTAVSGLIGELIAQRPAPGPPLADFDIVAQAALDFVRQTLASHGPEALSGVLGWLLLPFLWATSPLFLAAPGATTGLKATGIVMIGVMLVGHNEWVVRSRAKFEEAALARAQRESRKKRPGARYWKTSLRSRRRGSFRLTPIGAPELGILWKNSMMVTRISFTTLALFGLVMIGVALAIPIVFSSPRVAPSVIISLGFMTMAFSPFTAAQNYRNDLRADLLRVEMVRPWPIEGWKLFAAEAAAPALFASLIALFSAALVLAMDLYMTVNRITFAAINSGGTRFTPDSLAASLGVPRPLLLPLVVLGVLPLVLSMTCLSTTLQNLLVLMFPGWVQLGSERQQGAAAFGQNMIMFFGLGLAGVLCLLPAALLIAVIFAIQTLLFGVPLVAWEFPVFGIIAATPLMAVVALLVRAGGRAWDNLDPSREVLEGSA